MPTSPVIEWRSPSTPFGVLASLALPGGGYNGAVPIGTASSTILVRLYNNFLGTAGIADATACVLTIYDDTVHQGTAITPASTGLYIQVQVVDYNGLQTNADTVFYALGGQVKHALPVNLGILGGGAANYATIAIKVVSPANATQGTISQGIWLEYNSTA